MMMEGKKREMKKIVMLPWLAHGHISPFVELAKKLCKHNFHIYLCSSPVNLNGIKSKLSSENSFSIELVELHLPSLPDLPPHMHTTNGLSLPLIPTLFKAFDNSAPNFSILLQKLNPDFLITDLLQPWAASIASSLNIPCVYFITAAAFIPCLALHSFNPENQLPESDLIDTNQYSTPKSVEAPVIWEVKSVRERLLESILDAEHYSSNLILANTFKEMEGRFIDFLSLSLKKKILPIGPLIEEPSPKSNNGEEKSEILEWLDGKKPKSTIYVSFGSECYLSKEDREELAHGLEQSGANFIWVVRFPKGEKLIEIEKELPNGFFERVGERGMVVEWAPQIKILEHSSIGGFVSHCGWSSVMEATVLGVPIIALPMQLDNPYNAKLAVDFGVCMVAKRGKEGQVLREEVAKAIKEVVFEKTGERISSKAKEIRQVLKEEQGEIIHGLVSQLNQLLSEAN